MYYFYEVTYCDEVLTEKDKLDLGLLHAENYTEAMEIITRHYGDRYISSVNLLTPFTDNSVVILDMVAKDHIEMIDENGF